MEKSDYHMMTWLWMYKVNDVTLLLILFVFLVSNCFSCFQVYRATHRLLLLGAGESGKSTLVKQMKILHVEEPFSPDEIAEKKADIRQNVRDAILTLAQAMGSIDPPLAPESSEASESYNYVLKECTRADFDYPGEFWEHARVLWTDPNVQRCFERSNEFQLIDSAKYFLDKVDEIKKPEYNPSEQDILRCRVLTSGIFETKFRHDLISSKCCFGCKSYRWVMVSKTCWCSLLPYFKCNNSSRWLLLNHVIFLIIRWIKSLGRYKTSSSGWIVWSFTCLMWVVSEMRGGSGSSVLTTSPPSSSSPAPAPTTWSWGKIPRRTVSESPWNCFVVFGTTVGLGEIKISFGRKKRMPHCWSYFFRFFSWKWIILRFI